MSDAQASIDRGDTMPKIMLQHAKRRPEGAAFREKDYGIWQTYDWGETAKGVRALACGLAELGIQRGDRISIVGDNRPQLYWAFLAIQALGAVPVPVYQDSVADEMRYVLNHAEVKAVFCENQEQVDKVMSIMDRCPSIETLIYHFPRGLRNYRHEFLHAYSDVQARGRAYDQAHPDFFLGEIAKGTGQDISIICYTSGTTGNPKGVMMNFDAVRNAAGGVVDFEHFNESDEILCYLPMAWIGDHFFFAQGMIAGFPINCPESADTVLTDLKEIGPTYFFAPPPIFENFRTAIQIRMEDAGALKRRMVDTFIKLARRVGIDILEGRAVGLADRMLYAIGNLAVYRPLLNNFGLSRVRVAYTAGAPMGPDTFNFYRSIGLNLKQLYGQTESCAYVCIQEDEDVRPDTVGPPAPGCEVKIADDGEVLYKSPGTFVGYYKNEEATRATKAADGWVHTGDAGIFTDDGHLKIIDRAKDVGKLNDGSLFAPQYIENKLKFFPFIKEAVAHGIDRDYVTAFINIDLDAVSNWAERNGISYASYAELSGRDEIYDLIQRDIEGVNRDLAQDSDLSSSQIRRFLLLHKELDADDGELTRTSKVRRRIVADRYKPLIDALYSDTDRVQVESQVTFEDGRTGVMKADLAIREAKTYQPMRQAG